jgi:hypothetical protein
MSDRANQEEPLARFGKFDVSWNASSGKTFVESVGGRSRTGIYRLRFANGQAYIGKSDDVVRRLKQHRRTRDDIVGVDFRVETGDLSSAEVSTIRHFEKPGYLRNTLIAIHRLGDCALDTMVPRSAQDAWLDLDGPEPAVAERGGDISAGPSPRFEKLRARSDYDYVVDLLATYVRAAILWPRTTEQRFWFVEPMANRSKGSDLRPLAEIAVHSVRVFGVYEEQTRSGTRLTTRVFVAEPRAAGLADHFAALKYAFKGNSELGTAAGLGRYETLGLKPADLRSYLDRDPFVRAARELVIARMRSGTIFGERHSVDLASDILAAVDTR